jgi:intein/homing endonuclease
MAAIKKQQEIEKKFIFTSKNVEEITQQILDGYIPKRYQNPWFKNETGVRRSGLSFGISEDEVQEYIKCKMDIHHFAEKYCKVKREDGSIGNINLRDYQKDILDLYAGRYSILCGSRQIGKTVNAAIAMLHFVTFNNDKNIMIVANIAGTTIEIIDKIKSIYLNLPFFLKIGIKNWTQRSVTFENGCRIKSAARSKTPAIGFTIDFLYLDEFAHIPSNIIEAYYQAVYPVVSAVENSKIVITSTPNGMNLFYRLLTDAERSDGDPLKNKFRAMRVYWYQVEGRFVTYYRLYANKLHAYNITKEEIFEQVQNNFGEIAKLDMRFFSDSEKDVISVFNNSICTEALAKSFQFVDKEGKYVPIQAIAEVATWKEDAIKNIGGEDAFNQEYELRFINSSRSLLNESVIEGLLKGKKNYKFEQIYEFDKRLKFSYNDLKWVDDDNLFMPLKRKSVRGIVSIDISEGLGQDFSVINIFKIEKKSDELIELQKHFYTNISDFFCLVQIGMFRSNLVSVKQLAELFYLLMFEYFNPDNFKAVLEINSYGNEFLAHLPHVFDGNNNYGSNIFFRYKHRSDAVEEKLGLKVNDNKNILVKEYQDSMDRGSFVINNEDNIKEITTFVKHITSAGNVRYAADIGNDDCLKPGTLIKTKNGYVPIEEIKVGDMVLTHLGNYKPVTNICIKDFDGDMYRMKFAGQLELELTYNHPIYTASLDQRSHNYKSVNRKFDDRKWLLPGEINDKFNQISIIDKIEESDYKSVYYTDLFNKHKFCSESNIKVKEIFFDDGFAKFLGLFLADGNCYKVNKTSYRLSIAFNRNDIFLINFIKDYLSSYDINFHDRHTKGNAYEISFNNKTFFELMDLCYNKNRDKILPNYANLLGGRLSHTLDFWLKGDGWLSNGKSIRKSKSIGCSISKQLALSMRDLAFSLGKYAIIERKLRKRYKKKTKDQYWVSIYDTTPNKSCLYRFNELEYGSKIRKIEKYNYKGTTYNLEVEDDNSYIANGIVVHNCTMTLVDAASVFSRHDYREMVEDYANQFLPKELINYYNSIISQVDYRESADYSSIINVNKQRRFMNEYKNMNISSSWYGYR